MTSVITQTIPVLFYSDVKRALNWLEDKYGFQITTIFEDNQGHIAHAEMRLGEARIMVGPANITDWAKSPASMGGNNSQQTYIYVGDVDSHFERANEQSAQIISQPEEQFNGDKTYQTVDLDGHRWIFAEKIRDVSKQDMAEITGLTVK